jgi:hypothetical protein
MIEALHRLGLVLFEHRYEDSLGGEWHDLILEWSLGLCNE